MTKILLIRHAECEGNVIHALTGRTDFNLTSKGKKMSQNLLEKLKKYKIEKIYSSPSTRCIETIKPTAKYFHINYTINKDLSEKYFGIYDGITWDEVNKQNPQIIRNKNKYNEICGIEGQESTEEVKSRMKKCLKKIAEENNDKTIVVCSHGCAIEAFLRDINHIPSTVSINEYSQHNVQINYLKYENNKFKIMNMD